MDRACLKLWNSYTLYIYIYKGSIKIEILFNVFLKRRKMNVFKKKQKNCI